MEAIKSSTPKEFAWGDMMVLVKSHASSQDRMEIAFTPENVPARYALAARLMVIGWKGFTRDGKEVPYSPDELKSVPDMPEKLFAVELGRFIWAQTDISGKEDQDLKNG